MTDRKYKDAARTVTGCDIWDKEAEKILEEIMCRTRWETTVRDQLSSRLYAIHNEMKAHEKIRREKRKKGGKAASSPSAAFYEAPRC